MLIANAEVWGHGLADLRIENGWIAAIGGLEARSGEERVDAGGGALLPGLHDHHVHLAGLAARRSSLWCGPPGITTREELARALAAPGEGWIRAIGFHESVTYGELPDARELDVLAPTRPLRMQHRSGRMWLLNSLALDALLSRVKPPPGLERGASGFTGRLFDEDGWLREALGSAPPHLAAISRELASFGVTGVTDMSPGNDARMADHFAAQMTSGALAQHLRLAGVLELAGAQPGPWLLGPAKLHLHEAALPPFEDAVAFIRAAHEQTRAVAVHCVSEVELVFALAVLEEAGAAHGDRIEHASVASPELVERIAGLGLWVCAQPHFVAERGDQYLADVEPRHHPDLYRLRALQLAGIPLASGSDAPFASADPWQAMAAALSRRTAKGRAIGPDEALSPEDALALYLAEPGDFTAQRRIALGEPADLCLLEKPWSEARTKLSGNDVAATFVSGLLVHQRIDQTPA